jgi:hypothetical protein
VSRKQVGSKQWGRLLRRRARRGEPVSGLWIDHSAKRRALLAAKVNGEPT